MAPEKLGKALKSSLGKLPGSLGKLPGSLEKLPGSLEKLPAAGKSCQQLAMHACQLPGLQCGEPCIETLSKKIHVKHGMVQEVYSV